MSWEPKSRWQAWLNEGRVEPHAPRRVEIAAHRRAAERALLDAAIPTLSPEGRFQLAYDAALDLATVAVLATGHRIKSRIGHHQLTFEAAGMALGESSAESMKYFDLCRRRRNLISYDGDEIGEDLASELLSEATLFGAMVAEWLHRFHHELS